MVTRCIVAAGMILAAGVVDVKGVDSADTPTSIEDAKETVDVTPGKVSVYYYTSEESVFHTVLTYC